MVATYTMISNREIIVSIGFHRAADAASAAAVVAPQKSFWWIKKKNIHHDACGPELGNMRKNGRVGRAFARWTVRKSQSHKDELHYRIIIIWSCQKFQLLIGRQRVQCQWSHRSWVVVEPRTVGRRMTPIFAYIDIVVLVLLWSFRFVSTVVDMVSRHLTMGLTAMGVNPWPVVIAAQILAKSHGIRTQSKLLHQVSGCMRREGCQTDVSGFMIKENWKICIQKKDFPDDRWLYASKMRKQWVKSWWR